MRKGPTKTDRSHILIYSGVKKESSVVQIINNDTEPKSIILVCRSNED